MPLTSDDAAAIRKQLGPQVVGVAELQLTQRIATTRTGNQWTGNTYDNGTPIPAAN